MPTQTPAPPAPSGPQSPAPQGPPPPQQREPSEKTRRGLKIIMVPVLIGLCLIVIAVVAISSLTGGDDDSQPDQGNQPSVTEKPNTKAEAEALAKEKEKYAAINTRGEFRSLALPPRNWTGKNGRFIEKRLLGKTPAQKLDIMMRASAQDKVAAVGIVQTLTNGQYPRLSLQRTLRGKTGNKAHYRVWSTIRDLLTDPRTKIRNLKLNGRFYNTGLSAAGVVTSTPATYRDTPGTGIATPAMMAGGRFYPAQRGVYKDICANRQYRKRPSYAVPTRRPGVVTQKERVVQRQRTIERRQQEDQQQKQRPRGRHPAQPGGDGLGGGRPQQQGGQYGDTYRRVPGTPDTPTTRPIDNGGHATPPRAPDTNNTQPGPGDSNNQTENPGSGSGQPAPGGSTCGTSGCTTAPAPPAIPPASTPGTGTTVGPGATPPDP